MPLIIIVASIQQLQYFDGQSRKQYSKTKIKWLIYLSVCVLCMNYPGYFSHCIQFQNAKGHIE